MLDDQSMIYGSLADEYKRNLQMQKLSKTIIESSPKGSIQKLKRGRNYYYYEKYRENGRSVMKYLGSEGKVDIAALQEQINKRRRHKKILRKLQKEEAELKRILRLGEQSHDSRADQ